MEKKATSFNSVVLLVFSAILLKGLVFANFGISLLPADGAHYTNAMRIINGEVIYRDFQSYFPPLNDYFVAFLVKLVSKDIVVVRIIELFIASLLFPTFFILGKVITSNKWISLVIASLPFLAALRPEVLFIHSLFYLSFLLLIMSMSKNNKSFLLASGLLLAIASLLRVDTGAVFTVTSGLVLILFNRFLKKTPLKEVMKDLVLFFSPLILALGIVIFIFLRMGLLVLIIKQVFFIPLSVAGAMRISLLSIDNLFHLTLHPKYLNQTFEGWVYVGFLIIYLSSILVLFKSLKKKISEKEIVVFGLLATITLSLPYLFGRMDIGHLLKGGLASLLLGGFVFSETKNELSKKFLSIYAFAVFTGFLVISAWWVNFNDTYYNFGNKGSLFLNSKFVPNSTRITGGTLKEAVKFLKESENEYVFAAPYMPFLYYLSDKKSPVVYDSLVNNSIFDPFDEVYVLEKLEEKKIDRIVYDRNKGPQGISSSMKDYYPKIDGYIMETFKVALETKDGWLFMKRTQ